MNPITETRYVLVRYAVLWALFAAAWAVAFALPAGLAAWVAAVGGAALGLVGGLAGILLWNVLKYGTDGIGMPLMRLVYHVAVGAMFTAVVAGAELAAVWLSLNSLPASFAATIPARCLTVTAVYVCFVLWYSSAGTADDARDDQRTDDRLSPAHATDNKSAGSSKTPPDKDTDASVAAIKETSETVAGTAADRRDADAPSSSAPLDRVTVRGAGGRIEVIPLDDIVCLQAEGDYVAIVTARGRHLKEGTMKWFEEWLPRARFVRVHRSCIVAVGQISRIETSGRDHTLTLREGRGSIRISDSGYRLLKQRLGL